MKDTSPLNNEARLRWWLETRKAHMTHKPRGERHLQTCNFEPRDPPHDIEDLMSESESTQELVIKLYVKGHVLPSRTPWHVIQTCDLCALFTFQGRCARLVHLVYACMLLDGNFGCAFHTSGEID